MGGQMGGQWGDKFWQKISLKIGVFVFVLFDNSNFLTNCGGYLPP